MNEYSIREQEAERLMRVAENYELLSSEGSLPYTEIILDLHARAMPLLDVTGNENGG